MLVNLKVLFVPLIAYCYLPTILAAYPPNFHNETGCLYSYMEDGHYHVTFPDVETQDGTLKGLTYDKRTKCTNKLEPGNLVVMFATNDNNFESMTLDFLLKHSPSEGYWEVSNVTLKIVPINKQHFKHDTIELRPTDIYAGERFSYSCNTLVLQNKFNTPGEPHFKITLKRFQVQPFAELGDVVFAPSYDCAVWLTMPVIMGAILMLFITFTVLIGVYLMIQQGNQTGDLKFSKQGGMLMNQQQLDAIKG